MIASGVGAVSSIFSGINSSNQNAAAISAAQGSQQRTQQLITQLMSGITPGAYQAQAQQATQTGLGQLSSDFAARGLLDSGAMYTAGANLAGKNAADAQARYQQDRLSAMSTAIGAQGNLTQGYGSFVNPNPYGGLGTALTGLGTAAGQYLSGAPTGGGSGYADPAFGVNYNHAGNSSGILGTWGR